MTFTDWDRRLLAALNLSPSPERLRFLHAWWACERGSARYNPLNTTLVLHGSTAYNRAGVQHYEDELQGLCATLLTLRLSYYRDIRAALGEEGLSADQIALRSRTGLDTWGTGGLKVLAAIPPR